jgi:two-component system response regulator AdeR
LLNLTLTEYKIISFMIDQPHKVFTRGELMNHCMNDSDALERTVDSHVSKLRKKLEEQGILQMFINVRGVGYRLDNPLAVKDDV